MLLSASEAVRADGRRLTDAMTTLGLWPPAPVCETCSIQKHPGPDNHRIRWVCPHWATCRSERPSVLKGTPWYNEHGRHCAPRRVAIIVLAAREGMPVAEISELAGVDRKTVGSVSAKLMEAALDDLDDDGASPPREPAPKRSRVHRLTAADANDDAAPTSSSSDSGAMSDELSDFDPVDRPSGGAIHFEHKRYRQHWRHLPSTLRGPCDAFMAANNLVDRKLFYSMMVFLIVLLAHQPTTLYADVDGGGASVHHETVRAMASGVPEEHHYVVQHGLSSGALPLFDNSLRGRSSLAVSILTTLYGDDVVATREKITAWAFLDIVFRYSGSPKIIMDTMFEPRVLGKTRAVFAPGLTADNGPDILAYVQETLLFFLQLRTDISMYFASGDGRPQLVRARPVPAQTPECRFADHLLIGMDSWVEPVIDIGARLWDLGERVQAVDPNDPAASARGLRTATEALMTSILRLELVGRSTVSPDVPFDERVCVYAAKFPFSDMLLLLACLLCTGVPRPGPMRLVTKVPVRCSCPSCSTLWQLRLNYMFFGPSPRAALASLRRAKAGGRDSMEDVVFVWRFLTRFVNHTFGVLLCLYFLQMTPCSWRRFLRLLRKCARRNDALRQTTSFLNPTRFRRARDQVYALESDKIGNALDWLAFYEVLEEFMKLPAPRRRAI